MNVLTDHKGWPVAVSEGAVWWMVAEVEPTRCPGSDEEFFRLQLTNGQTLIARMEGEGRQWHITWQEDEGGMAAAN